MCRAQRRARRQHEMALSVVFRSDKPCRDDPGPATALPCLALWAQSPRERDFPPLADESRAPLHRAAATRAQPSRRIGPPPPCPYLATRIRQTRAVWQPFLFRAAEAAEPLPPSESCWSCVSASD